MQNSIPTTEFTRRKFDFNVEIYTNCTKRKYTKSRLVEYQPPWALHSQCRLACLLIVVLFSFIYSQFIRLQLTWQNYGQLFVRYLYSSDFASRLWTIIITDYLYIYNIHIPIYHVLRMHYFYRRLQLTCVGWSARRKSWMSVHAAY